MKRPRMREKLQRSWLGVLFAVATLVLSGCAVGPKYHPPAMQAPAAYKEVGNWKPAQPNDQNLGGEWRKIFQDPQLDALELQVNVSNQNLKAAEAQFRQARAALRYNRPDYYPTVTAGLSGTRTRVSSHRPPPNSLLNDTVKQYEQALELTQNRFQGGIASEVEVQQAKTQLQTTRAAAIDVGVLRAQYEHAVAILIGTPPAEFSLPPLPLTAPPPPV